MRIPVLQTHPYHAIDAIFNQRIVEARQGWARPHIESTVTASSCSSFVAQSSLNILPKSTHGSISCGSPWITMYQYGSTWHGSQQFLTLSSWRPSAAVFWFLPANGRSKGSAGSSGCESRSCILSLQCPWGSWSSYVGWMSARSKISMGQIFISRTLGRWRLKPIWMHRSCPCLGCNSSGKASCLNS